MTDEELKNFDYSRIDIGELLPQRRPFLMVSHLLSFSMQEVVTAFNVTDDNTFMDNGTMEAEGLVENIAQSCALRLGFLNKYILHKSISIGYVCAVKNFRTTGTVRSGDELITKITATHEFGPVLMIDASVRRHDEEIASGSMTITVDEDRPKEDTPAVVKIADCIVSPLGTTTAQNYEAVKSGQSELKLYPATKELPEAYFASLINEESLAKEYSLFGIGNEYTTFEKRLILSIAKALQGTGINPASSSVIFIISSTKGNVELLEQGFDEREPLGASANKIASFFGNTVTPVVVSNACISGLCAQITALRFLKSGRYDYAIVVGGDVQSRFIITGFQSFKALSQESCRPFDADRCGLNLGEAAATIIFGLKNPSPEDWVIESGAVRNDANHISGPSRTGEGSYRAIKAAIGDFPTDELALVSVHGTSTPYNDEMESKALDRAGLLDVPTNCLKGYYGHTMGAAGILESVLSMASIDDKTVLGTKGYSKCGVSCPPNISSQNRKTDKRSFVKLLSGFGGCNAAALFIKGGRR